MLWLSLLSTGLPPRTLSQLPTTILGLLSNGWLPILMERETLDVLKDGMIPWGGLVREWMEWSCGGDRSKGEDHVYHLSEPARENVVAMQKKIVLFLS
ncbi:carboxylesterase 12 [Pyrus ussuriensis x Pyrus communis]|uniref:Carboxylesterase 12 n=1 Tax=Pyrus ussuriensis x Pyrus communis TaxID=2448454 RepID=A0A5N5ID66_9ROSA|nr:carboxylesterase 12 [Pyrus ussuriensis x Pyrus communis]